MHAPRQSVPVTHLSARSEIYGGSSGYFDGNDSGELVWRLRRNITLSKHGWLVIET
jgi:hypothetical protein